MSEKSELKRMGATPHPNSGRGAVKGDGRTANFIVDIKEYKKSFSLSMDVWAKICTDALRVDRSRYPLLQLVLGEGRSKVRLAVIEWDVLEEIIERSGNGDNA